MGNVSRRRAPHAATPEPFDRGHAIQLLLQHYSQDEQFVTALDTFYTDHVRAFDINRMSDTTAGMIDSVDGLQQRLGEIEWYGQAVAAWQAGNRLMPPEDGQWWSRHDRNRYREIANGVHVEAARAYLAALDQFAAKWKLDRLHVNQDNEGRETIHRWFVARRGERPIVEMGKDDRPVNAQDFWRFLPIQYTGPLAVPPELRVGSNVYRWWPEHETRKRARKRLIGAIGDQLPLSEIDDYLDHVMSWYEGRRFTFPQTRPQLDRDVELLYWRLVYCEHPLDLYGRVKTYTDGIADRCDRPPYPFREEIRAETIKNRVNELARLLEIDLPPTPTIPR